MLLQLNHCILYIFDIAAHIAFGFSCLLHFMLALAGPKMLNATKRVSALQGRTAAFKPAVVSRRALRVQASADDKFANYKATTAAFFPGQGAQAVSIRACPHTQRASWARLAS